MTSVYFLLCESEPAFIKVGLANNPKQRVRNIGLICPFSLSLLGYISGGREEELDLHHLFDTERVRGEWFKDCPAIRAAVEAIRNGTFVIPPRPARLKKRGAESRGEKTLLAAHAGLAPSNIRERATLAHVTINQLMSDAGLPNSTFWRWERGDVKEPNPVTRQRILEALERAEKAKAA